MLYVKEMQRDEAAYFGLNIIEEADDFVGDIYGPPDQEAATTEPTTTSQPHEAGWAIRKAAQLIAAGAAPEATVARAMRATGDVDPTNAEVRKNLKRLRRELQAKVDLEVTERLCGLAPPGGWDTFLADVKREIFWEAMAAEQESLPANRVPRKWDVGRKPASAG